MKINRFILIILLLPLIYSCKVYRQNIMFRTDYEYIVDSVRQANQEADKNFVIAKNDYISIKVYTHGGERLIDPDFELRKSLNMNIQQMQQQEEKYLVRDNGYAFLPMIGDIKLDGYTIRQADSVLSIAFEKFYYGVYVNTKILNKRVVVLGALGGKVIPLENDNISVIEAVAMYGGVSSDSKAQNIRLIRGDLKNPDVSIIDLSTIEGMKKATLSVEPNDVIYIEPVKRILPQTLQDIFPVISVVSTMLSLLVLVATLNRR
jgi:polysaccharide export outer membrane protein